MLKIENLFVNDALRGASLEVHAGARALCRGENGAGKTTLVQAIIGNADYPVRSGKIFFDGVDITDKPTDERARMGIFVGGQNVPEIPGLSVMTFLKHSFQAHYPSLPMSEFMNRLNDAEAELGIPGSWLAREANVGFSGGEKKRLMFLHLLLLRPKFAILDEPDSGADKSAIKKFGEIIDGMKGTTFLVVSHLGAFFEQTAEISLQDGKIIVE